MPLAYVDPTISDLDILTREQLDVWLCDLAYIAHRISAAPEDAVYKGVATAGNDEIGIGYILLLKGWLLSGTDRAQGVFPIFPLPRDTDLVYTIEEDQVQVMSVSQYRMRQFRLREAREA